MRWLLDGFWDIWDKFVDFIWEQVQSDGSIGTDTISVISICEALFSNRRGTIRGI